MITNIYFSLEITVTKRSYIIAKEKKHAALPGPKTSVGELLIVNTSSKEEFNHVRAPLPQLPVR
jgi:hypothetical protein